MTVSFHDQLFRILPSLSRSRSLRTRDIPRTSSQYDHPGETYIKRFNRSKCCGRKSSFFVNSVFWESSHPEHAYVLHVNPIILLHEMVVVESRHPMLQEF
jgi:hypothetical protein